MSRVIGDSKKLKQSSVNLPVLILGLALIILSLLTQFAPQLISEWLPSPVLTFIQEQFILCLFIGFSITSIARIIPKLMTAKAASMRQPNSVESMSTNDYSNRHSTDTSNVDSRHELEASSFAHRESSDEKLFDLDETPAWSSQPTPNIDWSPLKGGGANFQTHQLRQVNADLVRVEISWQMKLFALVFAGFGGVFSVVFFVSSGEIIPSLIGSVFLVIGIAIYYFSSTPRIFDRQLGYYWKGRLKDVSLSNIRELDDHCALDDIYGIQIVTEYVRGDKSSYHSYELNLVLNNGSRLCVTDHGSKCKVNEQALALSTFLNKPLLSR